MWTICGTANAKNYLYFGSDILSTKGSALDAVEAVIKEVELNPNDWSVGYNGFPNLLGTIELDASIMIGSTRKAGAVAGITNYVHPISIARKVLELSPHVLLIGTGAEQFAAATGFKRTNQLADQLLYQRYENIITGKDIIDGLEIPQEIQDLAWRYDTYLKNQFKLFDYQAWYDKLSQEYHGTVNVIAKDEDGEICSGVSTSGLALKFPGRVGDSPLIGAGNYCDGKVGAVTCVGNGELAIRLGLARQTIENMKTTAVHEAVKLSIQDVVDLNESGTIQILAMDKFGVVAACSNSPNRSIVESNDKIPEITRISTNEL